MSSAFTARPEIRGTFGVVSTHWLASQVAMGVLERGGSPSTPRRRRFRAADRRTAPERSRRRGAILFWSEDEQRMRAMRPGTAPALATPAYFRGLGLDLVPGIGLLPATVPGAFSAWLTLLRDYGTWELADVLAPAIAYARDGFPLVPRISQAILAVQALFRDEWTSSAEVWLRNGRAPAPTLFARPPSQPPTRASWNRRSPGRTAAPHRGRAYLARRLRRRRDRRLLHTCGRARDTTGQPPADCASPTSRSGGPAMTERRPCSTATTPSPNAAPGRKARHLQQLAILRHLGMDGLDPESPQFVHRIAEAAKLAFADRTAWYGDPASWYPCRRC